MALRAVALADKYTVERGRVYLTGTQALVRLPMLQKQRDLANGLDTAGFISGYRGSPLGGYDRGLWDARALLEQHEIVFQPGVNEELAATALWGTQQIGLFGTGRKQGVFGIWYGKGPGVDRATDALKHANLAGTAPRGGVLALAGDDHACKSSTTAHQSEPVLMAAGLPVLHPATVQDVIDYGLHGFAMSRFAGLWVAMKIVADTADSSTSLELDPDRVQPVLPADFALPPGGLAIRWPDPPVVQEARLYEWKLPAAQAYHRAAGLDRVVVDAPNARLGIIAAGKAWLDVREALFDLGIDDRAAAALGLRLYQVAMTWPLEPHGAQAFARGLEEVIVVEEKRPLIEEQLKALLYDLPEAARPRIVGKRDEAGRPLLSAVGELSATAVAKALGPRLRERLPSTALDARLELLARIERQLSSYTAAAARTPYFCSGCPHNTSTKVPDGSRALAGIGCHYLVHLMDRKTDTFTQMGGEGAAWMGQAPFVRDDHVFVNIGDGTYVHSGSMAIRAAVAAQVNMTYKVLFNDAVAMTGGQPVEGQLTVGQMTRQLLAEGVSAVHVVTDEPEKYGLGSGLGEGVGVYHRDELDRVQRELRAVPGVTVIVYDQLCATEKRRRRKRGTMVDPKRRVFINDLVCEGCGDCSVQSNCLSVEPLETEFGRKRQINQSTCNKDTSCLKGFCPSFVTVEGGELRKPSVVDDGQPLPEPARAQLESACDILVTGVGGTGVVTIAELLGMAAHLEGKGVVTFNQTGLSQKYGAVTSHIRIARDPDAVLAPRVGDGKVRLLLGCDLVVAAAKEALAKIDPEAGHAVVNAQASSTTAFVLNPDAPLPNDLLAKAIAQATGAERTDVVDATRLGTGLLGDAIAANGFLLGYACQKGLLPVGPSAIERAIELNGTAVAMNRAAFTWGRRAALDLAAVEAKLAPRKEPVAQDLATLVARRRAFLEAYQNRAYAERYAARVEAVRQAEAVAVGGDALARTVARYLFKLMAYKDEYEVARLWADTSFLDELRARFDGPVKVDFHLAPPLFAPKDARGQLQKQRFAGWWTLPAFKLLAKLKFLRGTRLDPFGWTAERRSERQLIVDYETLVDELVAHLDRDTHALALELAAIPERIRGFGHVKERHLHEAKAREAELLAEFRAAAQRPRLAA
ncbi:MAG: indolepyruvate ferredoxin oxidoreductase family protein [Geminicoccaceae bacterium]|nr:MAG: indolepyruvate ferredoxin oxidoreductase family protein [Geminicoccaceae bacterium]